jgi:hypothetical protein
MTDLKHNTIADGIGYLYRTALYLAKGDVEQGLAFLKTAQEKLDEMVNIPLDKDLLKEQNIYWAEKALDEYKDRMRKL